MMGDNRISIEEAIDLPSDQAVDVWYDIERALEGKNGYGGCVAEIYAYRLVPPQLNTRKTLEEAEEQAPIAGRNMTRILRRFVDLHEGVEIEVDGPGGFRAIDLAAEDFPPFAHRVHLRVSKVQRIRAQFARDLFALWSRAHDELDSKLPQPDFTAWAGATKDLLIALGMEWSADRDEYVFRRGSR